MPDKKRGRLLRCAFTNDSAESIMGDDHLCALVQELVRKVPSSVTIDWTLRESGRAAILGMSSVYCMLSTR